MQNPVKENNTIRTDAGTGSEGGSSHSENRPLTTLSFRHYLVLAAVVLLVSWAAFLASFTGLFAIVGLDSVLEARFLSYISRFEKRPLASNIEVILIEENEETSGPQEGSADAALRGRHADLVDALSQAGARVLAFDFHFETPSTEHDHRFARAIENSSARNPPTSVIMGAVYGERDATPMVTLSPILRGVLKRRNWGLIDVGLAPASRPSGVWRVKLAKAFHDSGNAPVRPVGLVPSFPLQIYMQFLAQGKEARAFFRNGQIVIQVEGQSEEVRLPVGPNLECIVDLADEGEIIPHRYQNLIEKIEAGDTEFFEKFANRIVMVGLKSEQDRRSALNDRQLYGVEIQASAVSNLMQRSYVIPAAPGLQYFIILTMGVLGALLRISAGRAEERRISLKRLIGNIPFLPPFLLETPIPLAPLLFSMGYIFVAATVYQWNRLLFDFSYDIFTLFFTYWIVGIVLSRLTLNALKSPPVEPNEQVRRARSKLKEKTA